MDRDIFGVTHLEESDEESESSGSDKEDAATADVKRPSHTHPKASDAKPSVISAADEEVPTDEFVKSSGKFSFGSHDANERDVSDLFIPDEAKKLDDVKLFVSEDDPDLLE